MGPDCYAKALARCEANRAWERLHRLGIHKAAFDGAFRYALDVTGCNVMAYTGTIPRRGIRSEAGSMHVALGNYILVPFTPLFPFGLPLPF